MRVVLNATTAIGNKTGIGRYTAELLRCLQAKMRPEELFAYPHEWVRKLRARWKNATSSDRAPTQVEGPPRRRWPNPRRAVISMLRPMGHALLWGYDHTLMRRTKFDLYHEPNYVPIACDIPTAITIHDVSHLRHPEWHPTERLAYFDRHFPKAVERAVHFFAVSEFVRRELVELLNIPAEKITCTPNGTRSDLRPMERGEVVPVLERLGLPENYLLHLGTIEPRKNLLRLMRAYVDLPAPLRAKHPLVLAGGWGWRFDETAEFFHRTAKHQGVIQTGFLPDADLPAVYNGARALVFPTLYEGFGIPVVEMMGCGGAVLASTAGAVAEVAGRQACLIEPENIDAWSAAMRRVLTDDDWWNSLRQGAADRARLFRWERTADETLNVYRRLIEGKQAETSSRSRAA